MARGWDDYRNANRLGLTTRAKRSPYSVPDSLRAQPAWPGTSRGYCRQTGIQPSSHPHLTNWNPDEGVERGTGLKGGGILEEAMLPL